MKLLNKPVWAEGMYLGPHHFQAQSRYFEDSLNFVTATLWRDAYGFAGLEFDNDALRNGTLTLTHAHGLFEDGLAFDLPGSDACSAAARIPRSVFPGRRSSHHASCRSGKSDRRAQYQPGQWGGGPHTLSKHGADAAR